MERLRKSQKQWRLWKFKVYGVVGSMLSMYCLSWTKSCVELSRAWVVSFGGLVMLSEIRLKLNMGSAIYLAIWLSVKSILNHRNNSSRYQKLPIHLDAYPLFFQTILDKWIAYNHFIPFDGFSVRWHNYRLWNQFWTGPHLIRARDINHLKKPGAIVLIKDCLNRTFLQIQDPYSPKQ